MARQAIVVTETRETWLRMEEELRRRWTYRRAAGTELGLRKKILAGVQYEPAGSPLPLSLTALENAIVCDLALLLSNLTRSTRA